MAPKKQVRKKENAKPQESTTHFNRYNNFSAANSFGFTELLPSDDSMSIEFLSERATANISNDNKINIQEIQANRLYYNALHNYGITSPVEIDPNTAIAQRSQYFKEYYVAAQQISDARSKGTNEYVFLTKLMSTYLNSEQAAKIDPAIMMLGSVVTSFLSKKTLNRIENSLDAKGWDNLFLIAEQVYQGNSYINVSQMVSLTKDIIKKNIAAIKVMRTIDLDRPEALSIFMLSLKLAVFYENESIVNLCIEKFAQSIQKGALKVNNPELVEIIECCWQAIMRGNTNIGLAFLNQDIWQFYSDECKANIIGQIILRSGIETKESLMNHLGSNLMLNDSITKYMHKLSINTEDQNVINALYDPVYDLMKEHDPIRKTAREPLDILNQECKRVSKNSKSSSSEQHLLEELIFAIKNKSFNEEQRGDFVRANVVKLEKILRMHDASNNHRCPNDIEVLRRDVSIAHLLQDGKDEILSKNTIDPKAKSKAVAANPKVVDLKGVKSTGGDKEVLQQASEPIISDVSSVSEDPKMGNSNGDNITVGKAVTKQEKVSSIPPVIVSEPRKSKVSADNVWIKGDLGGEVKGARERLAAEVPIVVNNPQVLDSCVDGEKVSKVITKKEEVQSDATTVGKKKSKRHSRNASAKHKNDQTVVVASSSEIQKPKVFVKQAESQSAEPVVDNEKKYTSTSIDLSTIGISKGNYSQGIKKVLERVNSPSLNPIATNVAQEFADNVVVDSEQKDDKTVNKVAVPSTPVTTVASEKVGFVQKLENERAVTPIRSRSASPVIKDNKGDSGSDEDVSNATKEDDVSAASNSSFANRVSEQRRMDVYTYHTYMNQLFALNRSNNSLYRSEGGAWYPEQNTYSVNGNALYISDYHNQWYECQSHGNQMPDMNAMMQPQTYYTYHHLRSKNQWFAFEHTSGDLSIHTQQYGWQPCQKYYNYREDNILEIHGKGQKYYQCDNYGNQMPILQNNQTYVQRYNVEQTNSSAVQK